MSCLCIFICEVVKIFQVSVGTPSACPLAKTKNNIFFNAKVALT